MRKQTIRRPPVEDRLRQSRPPIHAADHARVSIACARIAAAPTVSPLREPHTFIKPLLRRVAACAALLLGVGLLLRPTPPPTVPARPSLSLCDLTALVSTPALENTLASEASDLASDLAALTAVLNERTLAILF